MKMCKGIYMKGNKTTSREYNFKYDENEIYLNLDDIVVVPSQYERYSFVIITDIGNECDIDSPLTRVLCVVPEEEEEE